MTLNNINEQSFQEDIFSNQLVEYRFVFVYQNISSCLLYLEQICNAHTYRGRSSSTKKSNNRPQSQNKAFYQLGTVDLLPHCPTSSPYESDAYKHESMACLPT